MRPKKERIFVLILLMSSLVMNVRAQGPAQQGADMFDPIYHFYPSIDPTGLYYYTGKYYMNWGSASSDDLVHWQMTPFGIERSMFFRRISSNNNAGQNDAAQAMESQRRRQVIGGGSGTVIVDWENCSGLGTKENPPLLAFQHDATNFNAVIQIAYSLDTARTWQLAERPPVQLDRGVYRDPKIFWYEPEEKWIMVMGWANIQKVKFFSSKNLLDWQYMSEFGPWGAMLGEWECVDFFPLPVNGDKTNIKWVLTISLQPCNGEYFVGDFDGKRFILDVEFIKSLTHERFLPQGKVIFDFERGIDDWEMEGDAFLECPTEAEMVLGKEGLRYINSSHNRVAGKGKITSPEFTIDKNYMTFLVGGGCYPGEESVNLIIDGKIVRSQTGNSNSTNMNWAGWDVSEYRGRTARIEIVDKISEGFGMGARGFIYCDAFTLCDDYPQYTYYNGWEKAFWIDWGPDFYAVRSWNSYAPGEERTIWVGWMGIWRYFFTEPQKGLISVPRNLELKTLPEGLRLIQTPIKELESLRTAHKVLKENIFEGNWMPGKFTPSQNAYELVVEIENISAEEFGLDLCVGDNEKTVIGYNLESQELYVDRRNSGIDDFSPVFPVISRGPMKNRTGIIKLHIFVDKCSVEVFGNDGETTISSKIYPGKESLGIGFFSNHGKVKVRSVDLWELESVKLY
jgi:sucrose-6-phosphate hydrolase SacC (GH32 family)